MKKENTINTTPEYLQQEINRIFNSKNILAISYFLNNLVDLRTVRVKENEFLTVVEAAKIDAQMDLIKQIIEITNSK